MTLPRLVPVMLVLALVAVGCANATEPAPPPTEEATEAPEPSEATSDTTPAPDMKGLELRRQMTGDDR